MHIFIFLIFHSIKSCLCLCIAGCVRPRFVYHRCNYFVVSATKSWANESNSTSFLLSNGQQGCIASRWLSNETRRTWLPLKNSQFNIYILIARSSFHFFCLLNFLVYNSSFFVFFKDNAFCYRLMIFT